MPCLPAGQGEGPGEEERDLGGVPARRPDAGLGVRGGQRGESVGHAQHDRAHAHPVAAPRGQLHGGGRHPQPRHLPPRPGASLQTSGNNQGGENRTLQRVNGISRA
eukprot:9467781-Pyramimonas_sp.AAC.1